MDIFEEIVEAKKVGSPVVLATVVDSKGSTPRGHGARMLIKRDGSTIGTIGGGAIEKVVVDEALTLMSAEGPKLIRHTLADIGMSCGGDMSVFLEPINPAPKLYIFGAGHIGSVLSQIAKLMDFEVAVIDNRPDFANKKRLPWVDEVIAEDYLSAIEKLTFNENTYIVILTHKHVHDFDVLDVCIQKPHFYIGMIGSRKKVALVLQKLRDKGIEEELIKNIHAPVGVKISANTPSEIAVSISAELVAMKNQKVKTPSSCPSAL